jgi:anti-sigma factor RsiW
MRKPFVFLSPFKRSLGCTSAVPLLGPYHDGELGARPSRLVRDHVAGCDRCRAELESLSLLGGDLRRAVAARAAAVPDVSSAVAAEAARRARLRETGLLPLLSERFSLAYAAAVAAFVLALAAALVAVPLALQEKRDAVNDVIVESLEYSAGEVKITTVDPSNSTVIWIMDDDEAG